MRMRLLMICVLFEFIKRIILPASSYIHIVVISLIIIIVKPSRPSRRQTERQRMAKPLSLRVLEAAYLSIVKVA